MHQSHYSEPNVTVVATDRLVLLNTPTQFLEIQFHGRCVTKPANDVQTRTQIDLFSRSFTPLYQKDDDHQLKLIFDGAVIDFGLMIYSHAQEIEDPVRDIYPRPGTYNLVERIPTPETAQIKTKNPGKFLMVEKMTTAKLLSLDQINRVVRAQRVSFTLGTATLALNDEQREILLEFARAINLPDPNAPTVDSERAADDSAVLPNLDLANASLDATLDWLQKRMSISGRIVAPNGVRARWEMVTHSGCTITVSLNVDKTVPAYEIMSYAPSLNFTANLAFLNPELVRIDDSLTNSRVWIKTVAGDYAIKAYNVLGGTGKHFDERSTMVASFDLRKDGSATMAREALVHAIKLCQSQQAAR